MAAGLAEKIRQRPRLVHAGGERFLGLAWPALEWLEHHLRPEMTTLETGSGQSTLLFAAAGCRHVAISPAPDEHERVLAWCTEEGIDAGRVSFIAESSATALRDTWEPTPLDVVLIDGLHDFPFAILDWHYTAPHLRVGGHVLVDDAYLPSVLPLARFLKASPAWELEGVLGYRTPLFRKLAEPEGDAWPLGSFDRRPGVSYLPLLRRPAAWARIRLVDQTPLALIVNRLMARRSKARRAS